MYRSRLQKLEERRNLRRATLLSLGTILTIAIVVLLGIPLLIRLAVFLADLNSSSRPVDKNDIIPPVPPQISLPYDATNSASQTILGFAEAGSRVFLSVNGEASGDVVAAEDGSFSLPAIQLNAGDNTLAAVSIDQAGNTSATTQLNLFFAKEPPKLEVSSQVAGNVAQVSGETASAARLTINDRVVIVGSDGKFATSINLNSGENVLVLVAVDRAGNQTRKELVVTATP